MRIKIEINNQIDDNEIIIRCKDFNNEIKDIQNLLLDRVNKYASLEFFKNNKEYYLSLQNILFFETNTTNLDAHTKDDIYKVKYKLYELEEILPSEFVRVSKSAIINIRHVYAITKNITSTSLVEFKNTEKKMYVSRNYYKNLKLKLSEKRI
ncbi:LytTR family DNA-binding domain-containing protein [uncultured Clostridium sp.]|uniref:LytTR family DNA-binding domain-containing protein n=1 Tax=uncultured Clostridium sp. TaxID=59620 RepID=UPI00262DC1B7|nr:LytTR family DNA-binding domain-containing protein [uncultured Clostridium sp.]